MHLISYVSTIFERGAQYKMVLFKQALQGLLSQLYAANKGEYNTFEVYRKCLEDMARKNMKHCTPDARNINKQVASTNSSEDRTLQSINSPILVKDPGDGGNLVVLARLGDSIADDAFVSIPLATFDGVTMALMKDG